MKVCALSRRKFFSPALFVLTAFLISAVFSGCATTSQTGGSELEEQIFSRQQRIQKSLESSAEKALWKAVTPYAQYAKITDSSIPVTVHAVRIDLTVPELKFVTWPESASNTAEQAAAAEENIFPGLRGSAFVSKTGAQIAFNTTPYEKLSGSKRSLAGVHKTEGQQLSPEVSKYSAIGFKNGRGIVIENQNRTDTEKYDYCSGGFYTILKDGRILENFLQNRDSRLALGLSPDGTILFILAVEGELRHFRPFSRGLSFSECAVLLKALGAENGLEMDGGISTSLFINKKNVLSYPSLQKNGAWFGFKLKQ